MRRLATWFIGACVWLFFACVLVAAVWVGLVGLGGFFF